MNFLHKMVPGKKPKVFNEYFSTYLLTQSEAVTLGSALAKIEDLYIAYLHHPKTRILG